MIPKIIHYCWFGRKEKNKLVKRCIRSWYEIFDDYEIIEWNEDNFDVYSTKFTMINYLKGNMAFVSDYVRLYALYNYGGIYLDADVLVKKKFEETFLDCEVLLSFMYDCTLSTSILGSSEYSSFIGDLLKIYETIDTNLINNDLLTRYVLSKYPEFKLNNSYQVLEGKIKIYPKEFFDCPSRKNIGGFAEHLFLASWKRKKLFKTLVRETLRKIIGEYYYQQIMRYRALRSSPFYDIYKKHKY